MYVCMYVCMYVGVSYTRSRVHDYHLGVDGGLETQITVGVVQVGLGAPAHITTTNHTHHRHTSPPTTHTPGTHHHHHARPGCTDSPSFCAGPGPAGLLAGARSARARGVRVTRRWPLLAACATCMTSAMNVSAGNTSDTRPEGSANHHRLCCRAANHEHSGLPMRWASSAPT